MIDIKHLSITFDRVIFDDASITLSNNSITTIKGKSGTGKTTLLNQLGLVAPLACDYLMEGHSIDDPLTTRKEKIGYVHQESTLYIGNGQAVHGGWFGCQTTIYSVECNQPFIGYVHVNR